MKKIVAFIITIIIMLCAFTGCNKQLFDTTYSFNRAIVQLPNGEVIEGGVDSWIDYEDGDQIQVVIDGVTYLVHSEDVALIND